MALNKLSKKEKEELDKTANKLITSKNNYIYKGYEIKIKKNNAKYDYFIRGISPDGCTARLELYKNKLEALKWAINRINKN